MKASLKKIGVKLLLLLTIFSSLHTVSCNPATVVPGEAETSAQSEESSRSPEKEPSESSAEPGETALDPAYDFPYPGKNEPTPSGIVDEDADTLSTIVIRTAEDLLKIGKDAAYPLGGDYTLVADLDLSHIESFPPIGGSFSECGIVSGNNVFSGTFDGRGHMLTGLKINVSETNRIHVGLFGSVGSSNGKDPAVIKNLILKDFSVTGPARGSATYAGLIGQANGNVIVDNIALLSGKVEIDNESGDILGIGALIGQCRTKDTTGCTNEGIHITNIFSNVTVIGDNNGRSNYTSGLIGRIRASAIGTLANVVQLGAVSHEGGVGNAISTGDFRALKIRSVYYLDGCGSDTTLLGSPVSQTALTNKSLTLDSSFWTVERGICPILKSVYESPLFFPLDFISVSVSGTDNPNEIKKDFVLPDTVLGQPVKWMSDNEDVIAINGRNASVTTPKMGQVTVTLTAYTKETARDFVVRVIPDVKPELIKDLVNNILYAKNYPAGTTFTWNINEIMNNTLVDTIVEQEGKLQLTDEMLNCRITLNVQGYDPVSFYHSNIPTLVITSPLSYTSINQNSYATGRMTVCTTSDYPKTEYSDSIQIKLRGNTTAHQPKRPFRLKLDSKTDLFGMGKSKHWILLANYFDRSNLRNKLSYDFGMSLGLAGCESTFVNVIFNGQYSGVYQLCEAIRIEEGRVDIFSWADTADRIANIIAQQEKLNESQRDLLALGMKNDLSWVTTGVHDGYTISDYYDTSTLSITGGYLIENDYYYDEKVKFTTENSVKLQFHGPENLSSNPEMLNYIQTYIQDMEDALYSPNRVNSHGLHYTDYLDIDSFLDFFMVNQLFKSVELFYKSCYMYKDVDGLLTFGPIWDMDYSSGNHVNLDTLSARYDCWPHGQSTDREYWFRAVYNDPYFMILLCEHWAKIQDNLDELMAEFDVLAEAFPEEAKMNFEYWNYYQYDSQWEVDTLRTWLTNRRNWMNEQLSDPAALLLALDYYHISKEIFLSEPTVKEDCLELTVSLAPEANITDCEIMVNGRLIGEQTVTDGTVIRIDKSLLRESGKTNSIEILGKKANGDYSIYLKRKGSGGSSLIDSAYVYYVSE